MDKPAVNLHILKDLNFTSGTVLIGILGLAFMGGLFILPLFLQQLLRYPAYHSGLAVLPRSIAMAIAMPISGRLYNHTGPRWLVGTGLFIVAISFLQFSRLSLVAGFWDIFTIQFIQGIGFGFIFVSLSTAALSTIDKPLMTAATGLFNVVRQVSGSIGIALTATLLSWGQARNRSVLIEHITVFRDVTSDYLRNLSAFFYSRGLDQIGADNRALKVLEGMVLRQSTMIAYNYIYLILAVLFFISVPLAFLVKDQRISSFKEDS